MNIIFSGLIHSFFLLSFIACTLLVNTPTARAQTCANTTIDLTTLRIDIPCVVHQGQAYTAVLNSATGLPDAILAWKLDPASLLSSSCSVNTYSCATTSDTLDMQFKQMDIAGTAYAANLDYTQHPTDLTGHYWKYVSHQPDSSTGSDGGGTPASVIDGSSNLNSCLMPSSPEYNEDISALTYNCNDGLFTGSTPPNLGEFTAYYMRLNNNDLALDPRSEGMHPISGDLADIVVNLPGLGHIEFGRGTSYKPVWIASSGSRFDFPGLISRQSDNTATQPDRINRYSYARIISQSSEEIKVHWRYIPDFCDPSPSGVVHEIFSISSDGRVIREVHMSDITISLAADVNHNTRQTLSLSSNSMTVNSTLTATRSLPNTAASSSTVISNPNGNPAVAFSFDEGASGSNLTLESVSNTQVSVSGRLPEWHPGVSGTALSFDGYTSEVTLPAASAPNISGSFSIEAWVSLAAYPFGTVQIAGRASPNGNNSYSPDPVEGGAGIYSSIFSDSGLPQTVPFTVGGIGYLLAVDALGQANLMANLGGTWNTLTAGNQIPLHQWTHLVGVYDASANTMYLFMDGNEVARMNVSGILNTNGSLDFVVGLNKEPQWMLAGSETPLEAFQKTIFGFEGLIDEVRLYDRALSATEVMQSTASINVTSTPVLAQRQLPTIPASNNFDAQYTTLSYHNAWDRLFHDSGYDDVVINFDSLPVNIVFWKGMSYGPAWISDGLWAHDQSMEFGDSQGLVEHMSDKQVRYSHVRVVEETSARVVVHWRYAPVAVTYRFFLEANELDWVGLERLKALCIVGMLIAHKK